MNDLINADVENMDPMELKEMLKGVQRVASGGANLDPKLDGFLSKMMTQMERMDARLKAFEDNPEAYLNSVREAGSRHLKTEAERRKIRAQEAQKLQNAVSSSRARDTKLFETLKNEPKEQVVWPYKVTMTRGAGGHPAPIMEGVEIRIGKNVFRFDPGTSVRVPKSVAERIRDIQKGEEEQRQRQQLLGVNQPRLKNEHKLREGWENLNKKYGGSGNIPTWGMANPTIGLD
jgi:hypothetical protein